MQEFKLFLIVIRRCDIATGGKVRHIDPLKGKSGNICGAVRTDGKFNAAAVVYLEKPHIVAFSADQPVFFHTVELAFVSEIVSVHCNPFFPVKYKIYHIVRYVIIIYETEEQSNKYSARYEKKFYVGNKI